MIRNVKRVGAVGRVPSLKWNVICLAFVVAYATARAAQIETFELTCRSNSRTLPVGVYAYIRTERVSPITNRMEYTRDFSAVRHVRE